MTHQNHPRALAETKKAPVAADLGGHGNEGNTSCTNYSTGRTNTMQTTDNTPSPATSQGWEPMHLEDGAPTYYRGYPVRTSALNAELIYDPTAEPGREYRVYVEFNPTEDGSCEVGISEFREAMGALNRLLWQSYGVPLTGAPNAQEVAA